MYTFQVGHLADRMELFHWSYCSCVSTKIKLRKLLLRLYAKFDCPVVRQNFSLLATAHDCETQQSFLLRLTILNAHVVVYRSDCRYLPYSIHFSKFFPFIFTRKRTKHENTRSPPFRMIRRWLPTVTRRAKH